MRENWGGRKVCNRASAYPIPQSGALPPPHPPLPHTLSLPFLDTESPVVFALA